MATAEKAELQPTPVLLDKPAADTAVYKISDRLIERLSQIDLEPWEIPLLAPAGTDEMLYKPAGRQWVINEYRTDGRGKRVLAKSVTRPVSEDNNPPLETGMANFQVFQRPKFEFVEPKERDERILKMVSYVMSKKKAAKPGSHKFRALVLSAMLNTAFLVGSDEVNVGGKDAIAAAVKQLVFGNVCFDWRMEESEDGIVAIAEGLKALLFCDQVCLNAHGPDNGKTMRMGFGGQIAFPLKQEHRQLFRDCLEHLAFERGVWAGKVIARQALADLLKVPRYNFQSPCDYYDSSGNPVWNFVGDEKALKDLVPFRGIFAAQNELSKKLKHFAGGWVSKKFFKG